MGMLSMAHQPIFRSHASMHRCMFYIMINVAQLPNVKTTPPKWFACKNLKFNSLDNMIFQSISTIFNVGGKRLWENEQYLTRSFNTSSN